MKRRSDQNDYTERGIYLVTIAIEGRKPLLGTLAGRIDVQEGPDSPHVELSAWGERVRACWMAIPEYHHEIECMKLCIMPDHIHGILFVHEKMDCHLGHVIRGFKTGTRKAARELGLLPLRNLRSLRNAPSRHPNTNKHHLHSREHPPHMSCTLRNLRSNNSCPPATLQQPVLTAPSGSLATTTACCCIRTSWHTCWHTSTTTHAAYS